MGDNLSESTIRDLQKPYDQSAAVSLDMVMQDANNVLTIARALVCVCDREDVDLESLLKEVS